MVVFPEVRPGEPVTISATTFVSFMQCPEHAASRLRGIYGPESPQSFRGALAHRVFARHLGGAPIAPDGFTQACREEIGSGLNSKLGSLRMKPSELERVITEVGDLYERFKRFPTDGFRAAEVYLELEPTEGVVLRGSVDAVFDAEGGGVRLIDWKTGQLRDAEPQMSFYGLMWALEHGELPAFVEAISVKTGERYEAVPTRAGAQATADAVGDAVERLREGYADGIEMARIAGPWCRYCPVVDDCSEGTAALSVLDSASAPATSPAS